MALPNFETFNIELTEEDIPGAALAGKIPSELKMDELRFWLKCRGDSCKGLKTKAQFVKGKLRILYRYHYRALHLQYIFLSFLEGWTNI